MLARLGLAWLAMMQVMMFAFPGYLRSSPMSADEVSLLDEAIFLMNWCSLVLTVPVVLYCAWPVWQGALSRLRLVHVGMDVPVALGIVAAFVPSAVATWTGQGEVYFDSVTMFVAFLLTARYLELCARQAIGVGGLHRIIEQYRLVLSARADRIAVWFTLGQLMLAFAAGAAWSAIEPSHAIGVMVALLVISCPCAMAMAVPTAVAAAHASVIEQPGLSQAQLQRLVQATGKISQQNLYGSMAWHFLMTPLAALGWVQPWLAAVTMLLSSLAVAANSWRLYRGQSRALAMPWRAAAESA
ncbi:E1-E2 ATPase OS=Eoetvoesiella caeni OX=645616 GN=DFR37_101349 PE=4 SV=1 [Eoetvoesiella caeni]|uniref:E1-E2 ATPase n=2 Tax=Eoetvoesiella caeni TaxID=645616 RepID=A0A366HLY8_9BURK|nr:E1-E2 ATPase [Eoetvoesiella caeni]